MKVFVKFNIGTSERRFPPLSEGEHDVADELGDSLIACGYAERVPSTIKAVPATPDVTGVKDDEAPAKKSKK